MTRPINIPLLTTYRLRLEPLSVKHSLGMFALWSDPDVCRYSGVMRDYDQNVIEMPASTPAASDLIVDFWMRAAKDGWGFRWAVALADTDDFAGMLGFNSLTDCSEIAYHLLSKHWGKGIMTEACQAAIDWQRGNGASEIEAFIDPENTSSIALARRLEMRPSDEFSDGAQRYRMTL